MSDNFNPVQQNNGDFQNQPVSQPSATPIVQPGMGSSHPMPPMSQPSATPVSQPSATPIVQPGMGSSHPMPPMSQPSATPMPQPSAQQWNYQTGSIPQIPQPVPQDAVFSRLFDFSFSRYATENGAGLFYIVALVAAGIYFLQGLISSFRLMDVNALNGFLSLCYTIVTTGLFIVLARVFLENCVANIRKAVASKEILAKLDDKDE